MNEETKEFSVGAMLPQIPVSGPIIRKQSSTEIEDIDKEEIDENDYVMESYKSIPCLELVPMPKSTKNGIWQAVESFPDIKVWNPIVMVNGKKYRERAETLIIRNNNVLMKLSDDSNYKLPGGGTEPNESIAFSASRECAEEVRIICKNFIYIGSYDGIYENPKYDAVGFISHVFIAEYDKPYTGKIDPVDEAPGMLKKSGYYRIKDVYSMMKPLHQKAIDLYFRLKNDTGVLESTLSSKERKKLKDSEFGIPELRKFPLNDKAHVRAAIKFFNHCPPEYKDKLAKRIKRAINKFFTKEEKKNLKIGDNNTLKNYIKEMTDMNRIDWDSFFGNKDAIDEFLYEADMDNNDIPDLMDKIVKDLEKKGYEVKYSSPGYMNTKFSNDANDDHVVNGKLVTTARVIFSRNYHFDNTPQGWEWKALENGSKGLYVKPKSFDKERHGDPDKAFAAWKVWYLSNLRDWVKALNKMGDTKSEDAPDMEEPKIQESADASYEELLTTILNM